MRNLNILSNHVFVLNKFVCALDEVSAVFGEERGIRI